MLPAVTFIKGQGGLGRPLTGKDFISALVFYVANGSLPSGFTTSARIKAFYQLADALAAGINNDYSDATAAAGVITATAVGANGDTIEVKVADLSVLGVAQSTSLGIYTKVAGDTTVTILATNIIAMINAGTVNHGYSATSAAGVITVTAPKRLGIYLNTGTPLSVTLSAGATLAATVTTAFTGGTFSLQAHWYYQISEFFRMQPGGILWVGFFAIPGSYVFTEITTMQNAATGDIRQIGILKDPASAFATGNLTTIDAVCKTLDLAKKNISALYAADLTGTADISTLGDLNVLTANKSTAVIGQDGGGQGNYLYLTSGKSVPALGTTLGTVAAAKVSDNIGWVGNFNISNGAECEVLAFANGQKFTDAAISDNLLEALNTKRYVFLKKFTGISGSYFNDSHTAVIVTSDYAYIENNRTIDKAIRNLYGAYIPQLNSPVTLNSDGTLSDGIVTFLETIGSTPLDAMVRDGEISAYSVVINPAQNVLATSTIIITVTLVIKGVARQIQIPIGFKPKIS